MPPCRVHPVPHVPCLPCPVPLAPPPLCAPPHAACTLYTGCTLRHVPPTHRVPPMLRAPCAPHLGCTPCRTRPVPPTPCQCRPQPGVLRPPSMPPMALPTRGSLPSPRAARAGGSGLSAPCRAGGHVPTAAVPQGRAPTPSLPEAGGTGPGRHEGNRLQLRHRPGGLSLGQALALALVAGGTRPRDAGASLRHRLRHVLPAAAWDCAGLAGGSACQLPALRAAACPRCVPGRIYHHDGGTGGRRSPRRAAAGAAIPTAAWFCNPRLHAESASAGGWARRSGAGASPVPAANPHRRGPTRQPAARAGMAAGPGAGSVRQRGRRRGSAGQRRGSRHRCRRPPRATGPPHRPPPWPRPPRRARAGAAMGLSPWQQPCRRAAILCGPGERAGWDRDPPPAVGLRRVRDPPPRPA
ncbi:translation initiation factor IF-2-like [Aquila chrysaetos chrysaetos]|uniref:translation initiation factor IF-2-like n=1 Tax=Aquila chrysaetos chrysaetos TaxID=223781 RepID=UPI0011771138|nr:translation initiation factor IF-2-like [Aquila chrysaetos chrysaetos]